MVLFSLGGSVFGMEEETLIFDDETDESLTDLLKPNASSPFYQALRGQPTERFAPSPIVYDEENSEEGVAPAASHRVLWAFFRRGLAIHEKGCILKAVSFLFK